MTNRLSNPRFYLIGMILAFSALTIMPVQALEVSGLYDFETFGDSSDTKPIGGLGPLNVNEKILSGWRDRNDDGGRDWWVHYSENEAVAHHDYSFPIDIGMDFNFYNTRIHQAKVATNFFLSFDLTLHDVASTASISTPGPAPTSAASDQIPNSVEPDESIFLLWRAGTVYSRGLISLAPGMGIHAGYMGTEFGLKNTIIEYFHCPLTYNDDEDVLTGWIRLHETSNIVELYYWKNMSSFCRDANPLSFITGMESGSGAGYLADEPPTDTFYSPPFNTESWHYGCGTAIGPAVPPYHYRYVPVTTDWDDSASWPEDFSGMTGDLPDWWSISNGDMRDFTWSHESSYGANPGDCLVAGPMSTEELVATRFIDLSGHPGYPYIQFNHQFTDNGGDNEAKVLLTWTTLPTDDTAEQQPWVELWSTSGSSTSGIETVTLPLPISVFSEERAQVAFKYTDTSIPYTIAFWDMETDPGWTENGSEWERSLALTNTNFHFTRGNGPSEPYNGLYYYALDAGSDNTGSYNTNIDYTLTTTTVDCTGYDYVELDYYRWLGVEALMSSAGVDGDEATIEVSTDGGTVFTTVWSSADDYNHHFNDLEWTRHRVDISSVAANQASVIIQWRLVSDNDNFQFCGWNLDDVMVRGYTTANMPAGFWAIDDFDIIEGPTPTPTMTPTPTVTPTNTDTPTPGPTNTPTNTPTPSNTPTNTPTPSNTPTNTPTWTPSPTPSTTPSGGPTITPTATPLLDCLEISSIFCGSPLHKDPSIDGMNNVEYYICLPGGLPEQDGNEVIFRFIPLTNGYYTVNTFTSDPDNRDQIVMVMDSCNENEDCQFAFINLDLEFAGIAGHDYYIIVDSAAGYDVDFSIEVECDGFERIPTTSSIGLIIMIIGLGGVLLYSSRRMLKNDI